MIEVSPQVMRDGLVILTWGVAVYLVHGLLILSRIDGRPVAKATRTAAVRPGTVPQATIPARSEPTSISVLHVSSRHEVALSLAFQGFDLADIARRCDITVAEAKLVATLAESYRGLTLTAGVRHDGRSRAAA